MKFLGGVSAVGAPCVVGDDELERADSERARKQIRMRKRFPRFVQDSSRGDDGLEGENPERARECIFARKRFPASPSTKNPPDNVGGIVRGDDGNRTRVISLED